MKFINSIPANQQNIGALYSHQVWLMNGICSSCDPVSYSNEVSIEKYIDSCKLKSVAIELIEVYLHGCRPKRWNQKK